MNSPGLGESPVRDVFGLGEHKLQWPELSGEILLNLWRPCMLCQLAKAGVEGCLHRD